MVIFFSRILFVIPVFALAVSGWVASSQAATLNETVKAGSTTKLYQYAVYSQTNCRFAVALRLGTLRAKNGTLTNRWGSLAPEDGRCKGISIRSMDVYYTPNKGFRGTDSVRFCYLYDKYIEEFTPPESHCVRAKITVK